MGIIRPGVRPGNGRQLVTGARPTTPNARAIETSLSIAGSGYDPGRCPFHCIQTGGLCASRASWSSRDPSAAGKSLVGSLAALATRDLRSSLGLPDYSAGHGQFPELTLSSQLRRRQTSRGDARARPSVCILSHDARRASARQPAGSSTSLVLLLTSSADCSLSIIVRYNFLVLMLDQSGPLRGLPVLLFHASGPNRFDILCRCVDHTSEHLAPRSSLTRVRSTSHEHQLRWAG